MKFDTLPQNKSNSSHLMLDIETMSTDPDAAILTIGAVRFDPNQINTVEELHADSHLVGPISLQSNERWNRHMSAGTIEWWLNQSRDAQKGLIEGAPMDLRNALTKFVQWAQQQFPPITTIWANSPTFDMCILHNAFRYTNVLWPWKFWAERDVRTAIEMVYPDKQLPPFEAGVAHDARDDVIKQALIVQHCHAVLAGRTKRFNT